jgi:proline iminopeptidase
MAEHSSSNAMAGAVSVEGATLQYRVEGRGCACLVIGSTVYYPRTFSSALRTPSN